VGWGCVPDDEHEHGADDAEDKALNYAQKSVAQKGDPEHHVLLAGHAAADLPEPLEHELERDEVQRGREEVERDEAHEVHVQ
jgi:hypothetical protein